MLVTSNFLFSQNVFYLIQNKFVIWITFNLWSASAFNLDWSKILLFGKELKTAKIKTHVKNVFDLIGCIYYVKAFLHFEPNSL